MALISADWSLWGLFLSAFISSTLLPGGSEAVLMVLAAKTAGDKMVLLAVATLGNTLGGMSSWGLGRFIAWRFPIDEKVHRAILEGIERAKAEKAA